jgi:hypothetical protein
MVGENEKRASSERLLGTRAQLPRCVLFLVLPAGLPDRERNEEPTPKVG